MIRFVYFDASGTLIDPRPSVGAVYAGAGKAHGLDAPPEALEAAFRSVWPRHIASAGPLLLGTDEARTREWWRVLVSEVLGEVGFTGDRDACFESCWRAFAEPAAWRVFEDVGPTLVALEARGTPKGILSNWDLRLEGVLAALGLRERFAPVLISSLVGYEKPDPRFFRVAVDRTGLRAGEIAFVGDHESIDVAPARALGIHAFLIDRSRKKPDAPHRLSRLDELLARLEDAP